MGKIMKQRVLLICNYFAPDHAIAAVRITKLAKYLRENGYEVEVLAEKKEGGVDELLANDVRGIKVYYAENSSRYVRFREWYEKLIEPHKTKRFHNLENRKRINPKTGNVEFYTFEVAYPLIGSLDYIAGQLKQIDLFRNIRQELRKEKHYDYVITSYGDSFAYFAGRYFHRYHKDTTWIFDIRDAIYRYKFTPDYVSFIPKIYERYIWKHADCITGISRGICRRVPVRFRRKVHCLTNGYDLSDRAGVKSDRISSDEMVFVYTGSMYGGIRDLTVLFQAVRELIQNGQMSEDRISFHYAGNAPAFEIFKSQAKPFGLDDRCVTHGKLSRQETLELQQGADILVVASYDYKNQEGGVITGKVFEYMTANRPVISIMMGDIEHSELTQIVEKTNIGFAYEASGHKEDYVKLCEYLKEQYQSFTEKGKLRFEPNQRELRRYDYRYLCKRLIKIMNQIKKG